MASIDGVNPPVLNDTDYVDKIKNSIDAIDAHDHTTGKGEQIPTGGIEDGAVTNVKLAGSIARSKVLAGTASHVVINDGSGNLSSEASLAITRGGTGQATAEAGFNALAPTTTKGDLIARSTTNTRLGIGSDGTVLTADSVEATGMKWATPASAPDSSLEISNLSLAASVGASALTIAVKDKGGSDPSGGSVVKVGMRNSTLTNGTYNQRTISSALSLVVSSGSTLGHASASNHYIYVYLIDNAGTLELAASTVQYEDHSIISTTAEGGAGAADSNSVIYSTTARSNVPIRLIGRMLSNQTTAGTWAAVPTEIKLVPFEKIPIAAMYSTNAGQSIPNAGSGTVIDFEDKTFDTHNAVITGASWKFTAPATRTYLITWNLGFTNGSGFDEGEYIYGFTRLNGSGSLVSDIYEFPASPTAFGDTTIIRASILTKLTAGQYIDLSVIHTAGSSTPISSSAEYNKISIIEVSL